MNTSPEKHKHLTQCFSILVAMLIFGCNSQDSWKVKTYATAGTVSINGSAPEYAMIRLHPTAGPVDIHESVPWSLVNSDGSYEMTTYESHDGAPVGEYALTMIWLVDRSAPSGDRMKGIYSNPEQPIMKVSIQKGENILPPIELKDVQLLPAKERGSSWQTKQLRK